MKKTKDIKAIQSANVQHAYKKARHMEVYAKFH